jgi:hypothetical protein
MEADARSVSARTIENTIAVTGEEKNMADFAGRET